MAHSDKIKQRVKTNYVVDKISLAQAAKRVGIPYATTRNWKRGDKGTIADWDKLRNKPTECSSKVTDRLVNEISSLLNGLTASQVVTVLDKVKNVSLKLAIVHTQ